MKMNNLVAYTRFKDGITIFIRLFTSRLLLEKLSKQRQL